MSPPAFGEKTICGSGSGRGASAAEAAVQAIDQARARLGGEIAELGFLFVSPELSLADAMAAARAALPDTDLAGCTTAGEITEQGLSEGGVAVLLIRWGEASHLVKLTPNTDIALEQVAQQLQAPLFEKAMDLGKRAACVVLGDGLSPMFEHVVAQLRRSAHGEHSVVGGGAGDGRRFAHTQVAANDLFADGGIVCVQVMTKNPWGVGVAHGVHPVSSRMTVTESSGNIVETIDGRPAFSIYREYAASLGIELDEQNAPKFLVENELGVLLFEDLVRVRAGLRVGPRGSIHFAGEVPEGSTVCIVRGEADDILAAARGAALRAKAGLGDVPAAGVLVFSCVCRGLVLGPRYGEEVQALRSVFPDVPIAGFSSYGEVACTSQKLDGYHNNAIVVAAIPL